jgi:hypothetical protein
MKDRVNEEVLDDHRKNKMLKKSVPDLEKCKWIIIDRCKKIRENRKWEKVRH